ncbi:hypothetical protein JCM8547_006043 [Rhodosporidiobolus lusitaniae]
MEARGNIGVFIAALSRPAAVPFIQHLYSLDPKKQKRVLKRLRVQEAEIRRREEAAAAQAASAAEKERLQQRPSKHDPRLSPRLRLPGQTFLPNSAGETSRREEGDRVVEGEQGDGDEQEAGADSSLDSTDAFEEQLAPSVGSRESSFFSEDDFFAEEVYLNDTIPFANLSDDILEAPCIGLPLLKTVQAFSRARDGRDDRSTAAPHTATASSPSSPHASTSRPLPLLPTPFPALAPRPTALSLFPHLFQPSSARDAPARTALSPSFSLPSSSPSFSLATSSSFSFAASSSSFPLPSPLPS